MVNVRSIFRPTVVSVDGDEPLVAVAERMQNEQVGSVVVMVGGRFAGILTERDLTRAVAEAHDQMVLVRDIPFYSHEIDAYWNDIGNLAELRQRYVVER